MRPNLITRSRLANQLLLLVSLSVVIGGAMFLLGAKNAPSFDVELISVGLDGQAGDGDNYYNTSEIVADAVSADGRYVVFSSLAGNLTSKDVSGWHVYLRDRETGTTTLVSDTGDTDTIYGSTSEGHAVISADGRYVAFQSTSGMLVADDTNGSADIFVYDRIDASIKRVSVASDGTEACACSCYWPDTCNGCEYHWVNSHPAISADGRYIAFASYSYNFVDGDLPDTLDVFVHDQATATTTIISRASDGNIGDGASSEPSISGDGNSIAFTSKAENLVVGDTNGQQDVFVWCRDEGSLTLVSVASDGTQGNSYSTDAVLNEDGSLVAFTSGATNLASPDSNGYINDIFLRDRGYGTTSILSSGLAGGGSRPAISDDGESVSFTSGTDDIYLAHVESGTRQLINNYMQFSALDEQAEILVVSGYAALVAVDNNSDKDVYAFILDGEPPTPDENCTDGIDNDGDGLIDCDDSEDCSDDPACTEPPSDPEICDDGIDNDGDGLTDCLDRLDCRQDPACKTGGGGGSSGGGKNR
jgi:Tol biopolymer transport system component